MGQDQLNEIEKRFERIMEIVTRERKTLVKIAFGFQLFFILFTAVVWNTILWKFKLIGVIAIVFLGLTILIARQILWGQSAPWWTSRMIRGILWIAVLIALVAAVWNLFSYLLWEALQKWQYSG